MKQRFAPILVDADNPGPLTGRGNNTYLLIGDRGDGMLIDAGVGRPRHLDAIDNELRKRQASLVQVIATHGHRDHVAGAPALARRHPGVTFFKFPGPVHDGEPGVDWRPLQEGDSIASGDHTLAVLHTPGHAPDHVALWHAPSRAVFVGDLIIPGGSVMIDRAHGGNMADYLASLERLLTLEPLTLYPAHGEVLTDPIPELNRYLAHRRDRERQVVDALRVGPMTVPAIADSIYDGLQPALLTAARETVRAHLDKLKQEGRAVNDDDTWTLL